jgi:hypothetical protein
MGYRATQACLEWYVQNCLNTVFKPFEQSVKLLEYCVQTI